MTTTNKSQSAALSVSGQVSLSGAQSPGEQRVTRQDSAMVSISAATRLSDLPDVVSSLVKIGVSATIHLRSGEKEKLRSAIATLNDRTEIVSAALTLRGNTPTK